MQHKIFVHAAFKGNKFPGVPLPGFRGYHFRPETCTPGGSTKKTAPENLALHRCSSDLAFGSKLSYPSSNKRQSVTLLVHKFLLTRVRHVSPQTFANHRPCHDSIRLLEISRCATTSSLRKEMVESCYVFDHIRLFSVCPGKDGGE
jgi:hypothetical protein